MICAGVWIIFASHKHNKAMTEISTTIKYNDADLEVSAIVTEGSTYTHDPEQPPDPDEVELVEVLFTGTLEELAAKLCRGIEWTMKAHSQLDKCHSKAKPFQDDSKIFNVTELFLDGPLDSTDLEQEILDEYYTNH